MSCGTGECGCGCGDLVLFQIQEKETEEHQPVQLVAAESAGECCEPVCGSTTCQ